MWEVQATAGAAQVHWSQGVLFVCLGVVWVSLVGPFGVSISCVVGVGWGPRWMSRLLPQHATNLG
jgi:hypothetical protein